ncbi:MAG: hypothetical protein R3D63_10000 [Paracoccaceae bacterium]
MFLFQNQRHAERFSRSDSSGSARPRWRRISAALAFAALADTDAADVDVAVLRALIEEFGGEGTGATLGRRLAELTGWPEARSPRWLRGVLGRLEACGAVTLEPVDGAEVIARISAHGVAQAYDGAPVPRL